MIQTDQIRILLMATRVCIQSRVVIPRRRGKTYRGHVNALIRLKLCLGVTLHHIFHHSCPKSSTSQKSTKLPKLSNMSLLHDVLRPTRDVDSVTSKLAGLNVPDRSPQGSRNSTPVPEIVTSDTSDSDDELIGVVSPNFHL